MPTLIFTRLPVSFLEIFIASNTISGIAVMSSSVSVGRPDIKYILRLFQPDLKRLSSVAVYISDVKSLFITDLSLSVPASGAIVNPDFLTALISLRRSLFTDATLSEGRETDILFS